MGGPSILRAMSNWLGAGAGRVALIAVAVAVGWTVLFLSGPRTELPTTVLSPSVPHPGEAPARFGDIYLCSLDAPYRAFSHPAPLYYAPNHPLLPPWDDRPDRCFSSASQAQAAGYSAAPGPAGSQEVDGVYLLPARTFDPAGFVSQCMRAATRLGFAVPCPKLLPNPPPGQDAPRCGSPGGVVFVPTRPPCVLAGTVFVFEQSSFAVPPGYTRTLGTQPSLLIAAYRQGRGVLRVGYEPYYANYVLCPDARPLQRIPLDRSLDSASYVRGELLICRDDSGLRGYLIARWLERGAVYQVALNGGDGQTNRELLLAVAAGIHLVAPPAP